MITYHDDVEVMPGDDWSFLGTLLDPDTNQPLDLSNAEFEWTLIDPSGKVSIDISSAANVTAVAPTNTGQIQVVVPRQTTIGSGVGRYQDQLRITNSTFGRQTKWVGLILVGASAFAV